MSSSDLEARIQRIETSLVQESEARLPDAPRHSVRARMERLNVPGVSLAVIHNFEVAWLRCCGVREAGKDDPITEETIFQAASISKPVAAVGALRLVQEGLLDLDTDVNDYLKSWQVPAHNGWQPCITLRQLLSHTAGLTIHGFPGYAVDDPLPTLPQILNGEAPANTDRVYVDTIPGALWRYSGGGTTIAQQVMMDVTGRSFPELMRELVFEPLGMAHSRYEHPLSAAHWDSAARGHLYTGDPVRGGWRVHPELAAAGLWTTPHDLALFASEMQKARAGKSAKLLTQPSVEALLADHGDVPMEAGAAMGIGFFLQKHGTEAARFGHGGSNIGYRCNLIAYQDGRFGAAIMTNGDMGYVLQEEIMRAIAAEYDWPDFSPEARAYTALDRASFAAYSGSYELRPGLTLRILAETGTLKAQPSGQRPFALVAGKADTFYSPTLTGIELTFNRNDAGIVEQVTLKQNGRKLTGKKLE